MIDIKHFMDMDLRTATIVDAERVEGTDKLVRLDVDLGAEQRQLVAGIAETYTPDELNGMTIVVVANLEPATIRGIRSEGMVLAADVGGKPVLVTFDREVPDGTRVR